MNGATASRSHAAASLPGAARTVKGPTQSSTTGRGTCYRRIAPGTPRFAFAGKSDHGRPTAAAGIAPGSGSVDRLLVRRFQQGERRVFNELVGKYQHRLIRVIARLVPTQPDAEDVLQETFIRAYRVLPNFRHEAALYTWLFQIGVNAAKDFLAIQKRRSMISVQLEDDVDEQKMMRVEAIDYSSPQSHLENKQLVSAVLAAVQVLPVDLATPLLLCEVDGMTYQHIATVLDCPVGTVRSRIFRARERIIEQIRPLIDQGTKRREKRSTP